MASWIAEIKDGDVLCFPRGVLRTVVGVTHYAGKASVRFDKRRGGSTVYNSSDLKRLGVFPSDCEQLGVDLASCGQKGENANEDS